MRGRFVHISPARRLVVDLTRLHVPSVPVQRIMRIDDLVKARAAAKGRPAWSAIFAKAYALVAEDIPLLRRAYIKLPSPRLYEYPNSSVSMVVEREYQGEMVVLTTHIRNPEKMSLAKLSEAIRAAKTQPVEQVKSFNRMLRLGRLPTPIRRAIWWLGLNIGRQRGNYFGTFGVTVYSGLGSESLHPISPLTGVLNYGVIDPDGKVAVRIMYDHRVLDGSMVARVLEQIDKKLHGPILAELKSMA
jgi:pyruvate/2-oxoglutarate dehydrogenase complex dihydrolipoamide acyltransferase (E2) component